MDGQLLRGHAYHGSVARDQARVHNGDVHNYGHTHINYYYSSTLRQQSSESLISCVHEVSGEGYELHSLKRKRPSDEHPQKHKADENNSLEHVLGKFGKFSQSIQDQRIGKDAKKIAYRIALVINAVRQQMAMPGGSEWYDPRTSHGEDDFEGISNCLLVAKRVDVNTGFQRIGRIKLVQVVRKRNTITYGQWKICLSTSTFKYRNEDGTEVVETLSSLSLEPRSSSAGTPIKVFFGEHESHSAASFIYPVVSAYRSVRNGSEVFELVKQDNLEGLERLLASGRATLRDCDEFNASLLNYACEYSSPRCCQYLIDHGADVERFTSILDENE